MAFRDREAIGADVFRSSTKGDFEVPAKPRERLRGQSKEKVKTEIHVMGQKQVEGFKSLFRVMLPMDHFEEAVIEGLCPDTESIHSRVEVSFELLLADCGGVDLDCDFGLFVESGTRLFKGLDQGYDLISGEEARRAAAEINGVETTPLENRGFLPDLLLDKFDIAGGGHDLTSLVGGEVTIRAPLQAIGNVNVNAERHRESIVLMIQTRQLKNGLKCLLVQDRKAPVVSVQMWVRTGSADESPREAGISHFIEHLLFKGTAQYKVGEIAALVEGAGGELNAYTSFDQTVFYVTIASAQADLALNVISQMMGAPLFDPTEIENEKEVVIEEMKMGADSQSNRASKLMFKTAFKKHSYGRPVIGFEKVIREVTPKKIRQYYSDRYSTRNMFLVVTGDFAKPEMNKKIEKFFGVLQATPVRRVKRPQEPRQKSARIAHEISSHKENLVYLSWPGCSAQDKKAPALDLLAFILGQGDSSRLVQRLRIEQPLVNSVGASSYTPEDPGVFIVSMNVSTDKIQGALEALHQEIQKLRDVGPTEDELKKALTCFMADQIYSLETVDGLARSAGSMEFSYGDPNHFSVLIKKLQTLSTEDIRQAACQVLRPETCSLSLVGPCPVENWKSQARSFLRTETQAKFPRKKPGRRAQISPIKIASGPKKQEEPQVTLAKLKNEIPAYLRKSTLTPTFSARLVFGAGLQLEPDSKEGLTELFSRVWMGGGKKFDEATLNLRIDETASHLGAFGGRQTVGLSWSGLSQALGELAEMVEDLVQNPLFPEEVLEREKRIQKNQIRMRSDQPSQLCFRLFMENLFHNHPYSRDLLGTETSLDQIRREDLTKYAAEAFSRDNLVLSFVGHEGRRSVLRDFEQICTGLPKGQKKLKSSAHPPLIKDIRLAKNLEKEQTHLIVGYRGLGFADSRRFTLQVLQAILAGQGGRLFLELRDKKSLAYSVSPLRFEGLGTGYFGAYIACSPEKTKLSEKMLREELMKLTEVDVPQDELERAKSYLIGKSVIELQRKTSISSSLAFDGMYGLDYMENLHPEKRIAEVTSKDVKDLARALFHAPSVFAAVGPRAEDL